MVSAWRSDVRAFAIVVVACEAVSDDARILFAVWTADALDPVLLSRKGHTDDRTHGPINTHALSGQVRRLRPHLRFHRANNPTQPRRSFRRSLFLILDFPKRL